MIYPEPVESLIKFYTLLPGVGEKTAERLALATLDINDDDIENMIQNIVKVKQLKRCEICGNLSIDSICSICKDDDRDKNLICVIEDYKSIAAFEKAGNYKGVYHVLGGLISPLDDITPDDINISSLVKRVGNLENPELIIALKSSIEGETTTLYIKKIFEDKNVNISRLSYGIPIGADIDYLDFMTLDRALADRKKISE